MYLWGERDTFPVDWGDASVKKNIAGLRADYTEL